MAQRRTRFPLPTRPFSRTRSARPRPSDEPAPEVSMEARPEDVVAPVEKSVVDAALYREGVRIASPSTVAEVTRQLREEPGSFAWIGMLRPTEAQLLPVADEFGFHEIAVEDAIVAHQRPKLERYGDTLFVVLRAATYLDKEEEVEFGEIHMLRRTELRAHGPPQPDARPGSRPGTDGERSGAARARSGGGPLRDPRRRRRRLRPGRRRPPEGHRRDRGPGVPQRPQGVPAHLRAVRRGHRIPALDATVDGDARRAHGRASTSTAPTTSSSATCATSPTTRRPSSNASTTSARCCPTC